MEHTYAPPREMKDGPVGRGAHKFVKLGLVRVQRGSRAGTITGSQIVARCEVGDGPKQLSVEELEGLLEGKNVVREGPEGRIDVRVEVGNAENQFSIAEVKEMIETVKGKDDKPKRGRPKKNAGTDDSGDGPAAVGSVGSADS